MALCSRRPVRKIPLQGEADLPYFCSRYSQGRHEELLEFTEALVIDGYQVGMVVGGVVESEQDGKQPCDQISVYSSRTDIFAEMLNYWINTVA